MSAIRLARAATGRDPILKFAGAYHGHVDGLLAEAGSGLATAGVPASPGRYRGPGRRHHDRPLERPRRPRAALAEREFAAILAEPIPANMGVVPPDDGFLGLLREAADEHGALLVLDEVISGFRVARGGAQELLGVRADLTVMGKVLGGGLPAAAYGGPRELMERIAPAGDVYQAGTLSGNPLAVAAGLATLAELDAAAYERLGAITERLGHGLREAAGSARSRSSSEARSSPGRLPSTRAADRVLQRRARSDFAEAPGLRPRRPRPLLPRAARARRLSAAVAVRGLVPLAGPRRRVDRATCAAAAEAFEEALP